MLVRLDDELISNTPDGGSNFLHIDAEHVADGNAALYIAYLEGVPSACGAYRRIDGVDHAAKRCPSTPIRSAHVPSQTTRRIST